MQVPGVQGPGRAGRLCVAMPRVREGREGEGESQGESGGVQECGIIGVTRLRIVKASHAQHQGRCLQSSVSLLAINHLLLLVRRGSCWLLVLLLLQ